MKNILFIAKIAAKPLLILILLVVFSLVGLSKASFEIGGLKEELAEAAKDENVLKSKLDVISLNQANALKDVNYASSFFPGENPALLVLYQLRSSAAGYALLFSNLKVNAEVKDPIGFLRTSVLFDIEGPLDLILSFVNSTKKMAPNIWVEKAELNFSDEVVQATISTQSYWSPFPTKIPALTEPIIALDALEKEILSKISGFSLPPFVSLTPEAPRDNPNPFGE